MWRLDALFFRLIIALFIFGSLSSPAQQGWIAPVGGRFLRFIGNDAGTSLLKSMEAETRACSNGRMISVADSMISMLSHPNHPGRFLLAGYYLFRGNLLRLDARNEEAIVAYRQAIDADRNQVILSGEICENLGSLCAEHYNFGLALRYYELALHFYRPLGLVEPDKLVRVYCELGMLNHMLGNQRTALDLFKKTLDQPNKKLQDSADAVRSFVLRGIAAMYSGEVVTARNLFMKAEAGKSKLLSFDFSLKLNIFNGLGMCMSRLNMTDSALAWFSKAESFLRRRSCPAFVEMADVYRQMSDACRVGGRHREAIAFCNRALETLMNQQEILSVIRLRYELYSLRASLFQELSQRTDSSGYFEQEALQSALSALKELKNATTCPAFSPALFPDPQRSILTELVLELIDKNFVKRKDLTVQIALTAMETQYQPVVFGGTDFPGQGRGWHEVSETVPIFKFTGDSIFRILPEQLAQGTKPVAKGDPHRQSVTDLCKLLSIDEVILCYFLGQKALFTVCLKRDTAVLIRTVLHESFPRLLQNFERSLKTADLQTFPEYSRELYSVLIGPLSTFLTSTRRIHLVPGKELNPIPFEALIRNDTDAGRPAEYEELPFLVKEFEFINHPSSGSFFKDSEELPTTVLQKSFIGFAAGTFTDPYGFQAYTPLSSTVEEVRTISRMLENRGYSTLLMTDPRLMKEQAIDAFPKYSILQFSTHCLIDETDPEHSGLMFPADTLAEHLSSEEILNLATIRTIPCNADLVVLNGCSTGKEIHSSFMGTQSVATGFLEAGARYVLSTLWSVPDRQARDVMVEFYKEFLSGKTYPAALRQVKQNMLARKETALPYIWAGFILQEP